MRRTRRSLTASTWAALCAVWLLAFGPAITHGLVAPVGAWAEVCTAGGLTRVALGNGTTLREGTREGPSAPSHAPSSALAMAHCPLCSLGSDHPMLPPPAQAPAVPDAAVDAMPQSAGSLGPSDARWPGIWPRAPPSRAA